MTPLETYLLVNCLYLRSRLVNYDRRGFIRLVTGRFIVRRPISFLTTTTTNGGCKETPVVNGINFFVGNLDSPKIKKLEKVFF